MYEVMYTPLETFGGTVESNSTNVSGSDLSVVLTGLEEYVNYIISVRAFTIVRQSNGSIIVTVETFQDVKNVCLLFVHIQYVVFPYCF